MFESARIKLTFFYLLIIMLISLLFSFAIYERVDREFDRFERIQSRIQRDIDEGRLRPFPSNLQTAQIEPQMISAARSRLALTLFVINLSILALSGAAGYLLAGLTLRPIKNMLDEQNRFITDSSHELRTPLTSLRSEIEVALRNKKMTLPEARKLLASNLEETISLQLLSDNLLELAQNGNSTPREIEEVSILSVIKSAVKKIEPLAIKKEVKIQNKVQDANIRGVADRLVETFVILLDNAVKYSKHGGKIELSSENTHDSIGILVTDHGAGIEREDLPKIFDRFFRGDRSRSQSDGYGLGLSIAKKVIESHGGRIEVESYPEKFTTFQVTLPYKS